MSRWSASEQRKHGGLFRIIITPPGGSAQDVTFFRGIPTEISSFSSGDPFGDATAQFVFPSVSAFDERGSGEMQWCKDHALVDIYLVFPTSAGSDDVIDPFTQEVGLDYPGQEVKVWEGYFTVFAYDDQGHLTITCQGALFQLDKYRAKPQYPARPIPSEILIRDAMDPSAKPNLRTRPLRTDFPAGWTKVAQQVTSPDIFTPIGTYPGQPISGYSTRQTGSWDSVLTGFIQDLLSVMFVDDVSGAVPGNQWTVRKEINRQPVLMVRDRLKKPDFTIVYGTPGIVCRLTRDLTQYANVAYGEGTSTDGTGWRNASISTDGSKTDFIPLAYSRDVYPVGSSNPLFNRDLMVSESYIKYGSGFPLEQAYTSAAKTLQRDIEPGWTGDITLQVDPSGELSKWLVKAGMTVLLTHFVGTGDQGIRLHVAEVTQSPNDGTVSMKVDTQYRDLLTLEEVQSKVRDPLSPTKLLQINRRSVTIEDRMAPWDYKSGSGFIPKASMDFFADKPVSDPFPWYAHVAARPPGFYPQYYIRVQGDSPYREERWTCGEQVPIIVSEKGTIRRTELACFYEDGSIANVSFHFSVYPEVVTPWDMPFVDSLGPSPFLLNAFQKIDENGTPTDPPLWPHDGLIIGWGDHDQRAGFWPGRYSEGHPATGCLVDESGWSYDCTSNPEFDKGAGAGVAQDVSAFTIYGSLYAESDQPVFFLGRLYREEPGT